MDYTARSNDPYINHFTQPDSIVPSAGNPQAWKRYSYALNNPIRYNDPTGHWVDEGCGSGELCELLPEEKPVGGSWRNDRYGDLDPTLPPTRLPTPVEPSSSLSSNDDISTGSPTLKDVLSLFNWGFAARPIWILNDPDYYLMPIGFRVSITPSATWNNDSVLTVSNTGFTTIGRGELVDIRFTLNSNHTSNYGIFTSKQVNSVLSQTLGFSLPTVLNPQELTIRSSVRATISMPSGDKLSVASTINTQIRYNPHGVIIAGLAVAPELAPIGGYVACRQLAWCP